ncbi:homeobox protein Hox-C12a-like [Paramormyrops kingsleyae]|uniref:Homeobox C12b n=1 Tax=Paramormyrops kingsleyae TaxID=1676925 RepID=A0A3B3RX36_9TELE|nr:homeobox protein Hox-C12a-like [Paramormyrops kingsleyae]
MLLVRPAEMGEHNLLNPGFVGPLVNIHTGDTFYLPNFRASGGQLAGLPSFSYPRRDNVCSLPWNPSEPCNGYSQSYLSGPMSINPQFSRSCELPRQEEGKCYYNNIAGHRETCSEGGNLKREDRAMNTSSVSSDNGLHNSMSGGGVFPKFDYGTEEVIQDPPSCPSLESDSNSSMLNEGGKTLASIPQTMTSPGSQAGSAATGGGGPWYPMHARTRKKRKPYSKLQLAELEGEFILNEFITRQRRRELSDRLNLSDQQVKIWFQNRRMKKKRLLLREQALSFY